MNRRGVALIIAISLLAALLFLALPFLFSQTASVAGSRAAAWDGSARRGSDRALGLAAGLTAYATGLHRSPGLVSQLGMGQLAYVQLPQQIGDAIGSIRYPSFADNSWRTLLATSDVWTATGLPGLDGKSAVHGAIIEDESRRIDPNCLDMYGWAVVLKRAGIEDPWTVYWQWDLANPNKGYWTMTTFGRLARALTYWRPGNGSRRYNRLEDLLGADPEQPENWYGVDSHLGCIHFGPLWNYPTRGQSGWPVPGQTVEDSSAFGREHAEVDATVKVNGSGVTMSEHVGWRVAALTQAELERLRPLLSFLVPGQGRSGLIDLGTVVASESRSGDWWGVVTDELAPPDTGVVGGYVRIDRTWTRSRSASSRHLDNGWAAAGDPLAIDAIPALNLNTVPSSSGMTRLYQAQLYQSSPAETDSDYETRIELKGWSEDPIDKPITSLGHMPLLRWLDPRTGDGVTTFERPPLGIAGFGIVAVEGLATGRDQQGDVVAQRRRRVVMQAVPQERPIEASWTSQGDFEALVRLRHGSWMVAGPHPTNRIQAWGEDASGTRIAQDMQALDGAGWLEPAPLCSFGLNPAVPFDWRLPFGLTKAQTWDNILAPVNASKAPIPAQKPAAGDEPAQLGSTGTTVGALTAQGLSLQSPDVLAYDVSGPLRFGAAAGEMSARHIAMRFCLQALPAGGSVVLLEARNQVNGADTSDPADGTPDAATEAQNLWRVEYRHGDRELVLVIANAALPWRTGDRNRFGVAAWNMPEIADPDAVADERCGSSGSPLAPPDPVERVEFRYKVPNGLRVGQWYHLQAFCASDRPGLHGLILDGVIGRDLTRDTTTSYRLGDHYTYPSLRLVGDITQSPTLVQSNGPDSLDDPASLTVAFPAELNITDLLPARGIIRIDDEYLAYASIAGSGAGRGTLAGVQRARRIRTNQSATTPATLPATGTVPDATLAYPLLQQHVDGALVTPGWTRIDGVAGRWMHGHGILRSDFPSQPVRGDGDLGGTQQFPDSGSSLTVTPDPGANWPFRGVLQISYATSSGPGGTARVAFHNPGGPGSTSLELDWATAADPVLSTRPTAMDVTTFSALLISMHLEGTVTDANINGDATNERMWDDAAQLMNASTGAIEWVKIDAVCDRGAPDRRFLINYLGWDMTTFATPQPQTQPRGMMRTPINPAAWPKDGTIVLPVQTSQARGSRLESGDVMTAVVDTVVVGGVRREPVQLVVRHSPRDGYPDVALAGIAHNVNESWFALSHRAPDSLHDETQTWLVGRGWSGDDLSVDGNTQYRRGSLPRQALLEQSGGGPARLFIGSADPRSGVSQDVIIDDLCAGSLTGINDGNSTGSVGIERIERNGAQIAFFDDNDTALPVVVTATQEIFQPTNNRLNYGLVMLDGEAFAYRNIRDGAGVVLPRQATLIARGLLGTAKATHSLNLTSASALTTIPGSPSRPIQPVLPAVVLPMGPVAELGSALPQGGYAAGAANAGFDVIEVPYGDFYKDPLTFATPQEDSYANDQRLIMRSPFVLIHDPTDNTKVEVTRLLSRPASTQRLTAVWLRGLYGTSDLAWTSIPYTPGSRVAGWTATDPGSQPVNSQGSGALNPVVIGWWPRYAPGVTSNPGAEALRSRSFAWAGFALRLSGSRFDPDMVPVLANANGGIADVGIADDAGCGMTATALAAEQGSGEVFDWNNAWSERAGLSVGANDALVRPFQWSRFQLREVDGAELRVHWSATGAGSNPLERAADAAGRAPRLENIRLRCVAPARVLAVEEVR